MKQLGCLVGVALFLILITGVCYGGSRALHHLIAQDRHIAPPGVPDTVVARLIATPQPPLPAPTDTPPVVPTVRATPPPGSPPAGTGQSTLACPKMTRLADNTTGIPWLFPAGWVIANVYRHDGEAEHKVLIRPGDPHNLTGWRGSAWWLPDGCEVDAMTNFTGNPLQALAIRDVQEGP